MSDIIGEEQRTAIEEAKAGRSSIPVEDVQGIAASKIQEDMRAREAAREQAQKAREQREADELEAQRQEAAKAAEYAKQEKDRQQQEAARKEAQRQTAKDYVQSQKDSDKDNSGWGDNMKDDDKDGVDDKSGGWGFAKGGYVARKNTPKKVLIKR